MKLQAASSSTLSTRCQFYTSSGRQCRLLASDQTSRLCSYHLAVEKQKDGKLVVEVRGVDVFDPTTGEVPSSGP